MHKVKLPKKGRPLRDLNPRYPRERRASLAGLDEGDMQKLTSHPWGSNPGSCNFSPPPSEAGVEPAGDVMQDTNDAKRDPGGNRTRVS